MPVGRKGMLLKRKLETGSECLGFPDTDSEKKELLPQSLKFLSIFFIVMGFTAV